MASIEEIGGMFGSIDSDEELEEIRRRMLGLDPTEKDKEKSDGIVSKGINSVKRGIDQLQSSLHGAAALVGSAVGSEDLQEWGMEGYRRNEAEAQENAKTTSLKGLLEDPSSLPTWIVETIGELVPSMAEAAIGAAVGSLIMPGAGTAAGGLATRTVLKKGIEKVVKEQMESKIKKGILKEGMEKQVADTLKQEVSKAALKKIGAQIGMGAAVLPMESGGNYAEVLEEHGIDNPWSALATGAMSTALEYIGGNSKLIGQFFGKEAEQGIAKAFQKGDLSFIKQFAKEAVKNAPQEAAQEMGQEILSVLNVVANTDKEFFTEETAWRVAEAGAGGLVGGGFGAVPAAMGNVKDAQAQQFAERRDAAVAKKSAGFSAFDKAGNEIPSDPQAPTQPILTDEQANEKAKMDLEENLYAASAGLSVSGDKAVQAVPSEMEAHAGIDSGLKASIDRDTQIEVAKKNAQQEIATQVNARKAQDEAVQKEEDLVKQEQAQIQQQQVQTTAQQLADEKHTSFINTISTREGLNTTLAKASPIFAKDKNSKSLVKVLDNVQKTIALGQSDPKKIAELQNEIFKLTEQGSFGAKTNALLHRSYGELSNMRQQATDAITFQQEEVARMKVEQAEAKERDKRLTDQGIQKKDRPQAGSANSRSTGSDQANITLARDLHKVAQETADKIMTDQEKIDMLHGQARVDAAQPGLSKTRVVLPPDKAQMDYELARRGGQGKGPLPVGEGHAGIDIAKLRATQKADEQAEFVEQTTELGMPTYDPRLEPQPVQGGQAQLAQQLEQPSSAALPAQPLPVGEGYTQGPVAETAKLNRMDALREKYGRKDAELSRPAPAFPNVAPQNTEQSKTRQSLEKARKKTPPIKGQPLSVEGSPYRYSKQAKVPELKSTDEAVEFGKTATPEQVEELDRIYKENSEKNKKAFAEASEKKDFTAMDDIFAASQANQFYREAAEVARKEGGFARMSRDKAKTKAEPVSVKEVHSIVKALQEKAVNGLPVSVIDSTKDLPPAFADKGMKAVWIGDQIIMVADKFSSKEDVVKTWIHESVGHYGLTSLFGSEAKFKEFIANVKKIIPQSELENVAFYNDLDLSKPAHAQEAVEEYIAKLSEKMQLKKDFSGMERSVWQKIKDAITTFFVKHGIKKNITDKDVMALLRQAGDRLYTKHQMNRFGFDGLTLEQMTSRFAFDKQKWAANISDPVFGTVNNRMTKELEIFERLFGKALMAEMLPGKMDPKTGKRPLARTISSYNLGQEILREIKSGSAKKLLTEDVNKLADARKLEGKERSDFIKELEDFRAMPLLTEMNESGKPILGNNGKAGRSLDFLLATCQPTTPCQECYAAEKMIRMSTVRKAFRNTLFIMMDPKGWAKSVAKEVNKINKINLPFVRLLGSGDVTSEEQVIGFNELAKLIDRPLQIFSRHHDNLRLLQGTESAPFIKMGSLDNFLFNHYGIDFLKENTEKFGIVNAYLHRDPSEVSQIEELREAGALGLVLSTSTKLHSDLPILAQRNSCPCDAHERSYMASCRQCAASFAGCFTMFNNMGVDSNGKVWRVGDPNAPKSMKPVLQFTKNIKAKKKGLDAIGLLRGKAAQDIIQKSIALVQLYIRNFTTIETDKKSPRFGKPKSDRIALKDVRWEEDVAYTTSVEEAEGFIADLRALKEVATKQGTFFLPGGAIQGPVAYSGGKQLADASLISKEDAKAARFLKAIAKAEPTDSPAFKKWFGKSVVTKTGKSGGNPLIVGHVSPTRFKIFDGIWHYFTDSEAYLDQVKNVRRYSEGKEPVKRMFYLSLENPLDLRPLGPYASSGEFAIYLKDKGINLETIYGPFAENVAKPGGKKQTVAVIVKEQRVLEIENGRPFTKAFKDAGYDGVLLTDVIRADMDPGVTDNVTATSYVVFSPTQIKSVFNQGTWNPDDPRIRFSRVKFSDEVIDPQHQHTLEHVGQASLPVEDKIKAVKQSWLDKLVTKAIDFMHPVKILEETGNVELAMSGVVSHRLLTNSPTIISTIFHHGIPKFLDNWISLDRSKKGIFKVISDLGDDAEAFFLRMQANSAKELLDKDAAEVAAGNPTRFTKGTNLFGADKTTKKMLDDRAIVKSLLDMTQARYDANAAQWDEAIKDLREFNTATLDFLVETGLISDAHRAVWQRENYMPFTRQFTEFTDETIEELFPDGNDMKKVGKLHHLSGGKANIGDPMTNLINTYSYLLNEGMRNLANKKVLALFLDNDLATLANPSMKGNVLAIRHKGKAQMYKVEDQDLWESVKEMNELTHNSFSKWITVPKKWLTMGVTMNPAFRVKNFLRDTIHTTFMDKSFMPFVDSFKGLLAAWRNSPEMLEYAATGGAFSGSYSSRDVPIRVKKTQEAAADMLEKLSGNKSHSPKALGKKLWDFWERVGTASENASRLGLYMKLRNQGASQLEAGFKSKDLLDFSMHGKSQIVKLMIHSIPFLNARIQGLYKLGRAATTKGERASFYIRGAMLGALALMLHEINKDRPEYKEMQDYEKWGYWHFFDFPGGTRFRYPIPFEVGLIAGIAPVVLSQVIQKEEGANYLGQFLLHGVTQTLAMNPLDVQILKPVAQQIANKDFYSGMPIVPEYKKRLHPSLQKNTDTSRVAQVLGGAVESLGLPDWAQSPLRIDRFIKDNLSWLGMFGTEVLDVAIGWGKSFPEDPAVHIGDRYLSGLGALLKGDNPPRHTRSEQRFYDLKQDVDQYLATVSNLRKFKQTDKLREYKAENKDLAKFGKKFTKVSDRINVIQQKITLTHLSTRLSGTEKRDRIDRYLKQRSAILHRVMEGIDE